MFKTIEVFDEDVLKPGTAIKVETIEGCRNGIVLNCQPFTLDVQYYDTSVGELTRQFINLTQVKNMDIIIHILNGCGVGDDTTPPAEVTNLMVDFLESSSFTLTWDNPLDPDFSHVNVYVDGDLVESTDKGTSTITGLNPDTEYKVTLTTVDKNGNESEGVEVSVTTEP